MHVAPDELALYMVGTITFINQVYVGFRASVDETACLPGVESMDCQFFAREDCPWEEVPCLLVEVGTAVFHDLDCCYHSLAASLAVPGSSFSFLRY